jgi:DNA-binding transcriptional regulator YdaS (Cro superfamily)
MREHKKTSSEIAEIVGVTSAAVRNWRLGYVTPLAVCARALETATGGAVPASLWQRAA